MAEDNDIRLLPEVTALTLADLRAYALKRARHIASQTPGDPDAAWDDPEEWQSDAAELAHAVVRLLTSSADGQISRS